MKLFRNKNDDSFGFSGIGVNRGTTFCVPNPRSICTPTASRYHNIKPLPFIDYNVVLGLDRMYIMENDAGFKICTGKNSKFGDFYAYRK